MTDFDAVDIFTDETLIEDPYPYFEHLRAQCPVAAIPTREGVVAVTGYDEAMAIYRDFETYSSISSGAGPFLMLSEPDDDNVDALIEEQRENVRALTGVVDLIMLDPPEHTQERGVLMRLLTPKRLRENEEFMWRHADTYLDAMLAQGRCEFIAEYSRPFTYFVIADLLGVPEEVHELFRSRLELNTGVPGDVRESDDTAREEFTGSAGGFRFLEEWFASFLEDRRREPKQDVLTDIALAKYPDGSTPPIDKITRTAVFLFLAGTETSARLLATCLRLLAEHPELQDQLRDDRDLIPNFVEEALRFESPVKTDSRTVRRATTLAGAVLPAGTCVSIFLGAANRDPRHFESPDEFQVDRPHAQAHLAFGRGIHSCPGGPLARAEARISVNRILDRMRDIRLSEEHHGPPGARRFEFVPTYVLRGLEQLHLEFTPAER